MKSKLILCCNQNNDLFRVLSENKIEVERFSRSKEAVDAAGTGDGVMILADGYPETTTPLDAAIFEMAAQKKLRLYVEYPSSLPDPNDLRVPSASCRPRGPRLGHGRRAGRLVDLTVHELNSIW